VEMSKTNFFIVLFLVFFIGVSSFFSGCTGITSAQKQYIDQQIAKTEQVLNQVKQIEERVRKSAERAEAAQRQAALTAERIRVMMNYLERKLREIQGLYFELEDLLASTKKNLKR